MYNAHNDPTVGILEFIACWTLYIIGSIAHTVISWQNVALTLQIISFTLAIFVGLVNLMRALGFDVNIKKRFKKKK